MNNSRDDLRREYAIRIFASMVRGLDGEFEMDTRERAQKLARISVDLANALIDEIRKTESKAG